MNHLFLRPNGESFTMNTSEAGYHTMMFGSQGRGYSVVAQQHYALAREKRMFIIDAPRFKNEGGAGLLPYEFDASRRLALEITGRMPRSYRSKRNWLHISDGGPAKKQKRPPGVHVVITSNGVPLTHAQLKEAVRSVEMQTGIELTQPQMKGLLERTGLDEEVMEYGASDTCTRETLSSKLAFELIGRRVPTYGDKDTDKDEFWSKLTLAAKMAGYRV